jgi:lipopolysaccharide export system protein LptA
MKNKLLILLLILLTLSPCAFAEGSNVISDSNSKRTAQDDLDDINQYTNSFFTPHVSRSKVVPATQEHHGTLPPVKKLRLMLKAKAIKTDKAALTVAEQAPSEDQAILNCDLMEYFAPRTELEANGNVVVNFPQNDSTIKADKMIYNQTTNFIKAFGHVVLINGGKQMTGDYMQIDLNEENALMDNPVSDIFQVHAIAKKGYLYGDKLIQEQGSMYVTKKTMVNVKAEMFGPDLDTMFVEDKDKSYFAKDSHGEKFKIKTDDLIINSKKEHDTLTLRHAEIYFNEKKIGTVPKITMHTNKSQDYLEADFPELGTMSNLGMYAGPGFVFDTPKGTTLKVVPMINFQSGGTNDNDNSAENDKNGKTGWGSIVKFKSATNKVDMAYGTANKIFIMRGLQKLDDDLYFQYASNAYMDDWFLGFRMPKIGGEVVYQHEFLNKDFFGKNKDMVYTHRATAGYLQGGNAQGPLFDGEGAVGTMRFKYMAEVAQTLYRFNSCYTSPINADLALVGETSTAVYGTGDTQFIARVGPRLHTQYKSWMQDVGYFLSAYNDHSPLTYYDAYMYGRSNAYMRESFRLSKYLTFSWLGSLNLTQDCWNGKMLQENSFFFAIGPDDVKLNIGYDTVREQSFVTMAMHLDAKGSTVEYKKMVIKNPNTLGKNKNKKDNPDYNEKSFEPVDYDGNGLEHAQIIDIPQEAL